jgi:hypothetical protein
MIGILNARIAACAVLALCFAEVAFAADILIADTESEPESLTAAPGGVLIVGSASTSFVYKVRSGSSTAEKFVDASVEGPGTFFFDMLADASTNTSCACQLTPLPNTSPVQQHTALRGFDLPTGAQKIRWNLPGDISLDQRVQGPDGMRAANGKFFVAENRGGKTSVITVSGDKPASL